MKRRGALLAPVLLAGCAAAAGPPAPEAPVVDLAGVLSPEAERALDRRLRDAWDRHRTAIVVATVGDLGASPVDAQARRLFAQWRIGAADTHRGLLVLIAPENKAVRIEVGCGLETVVTNAEAQRIVDGVMVPRFARSQFDAGASEGVAALITRIETANVAPGAVSPACRALMKEAA